LSIPAHFLTHTSHPSLHVAYECYKGCLEAKERLDTMTVLGEWTGKVPIFEDIITLFVPRSTTATSAKKRKPYMDKRS
jgi:hypothetical protein